MSEKALRRLSWEESQQHYAAIHEIEDKHSMVSEYQKSKLSSGQKRRMEQKIMREKTDYFFKFGITEKLGGFYVEA